MHRAIRILSLPIVIASTGVAGDALAAKATECTKIGICYCVNQAVKPEIAAHLDRFRHTIAEQRKAPGQCQMTLVQFDDVVEMVYEGYPISRIPRLELVPRNRTALYDGIGLAIDQLRGRRVECDGDLLAGLVAGTLDGLKDRLDGFRIGRQ